MNDVMAKDLNKLFTNKGYNPVIGTIYRQQAEWLSWYRGNVDGFHNIQKKTVEGRLIGLEKPSLQMAKKVCEDNASLLFNENVKITVHNDTAQKVLDEKFEETNYYDEMPNFIELTGTFGTGVSVEYIADNEVKMNYLFGDKVCVIDYENTTVKAVAIIQTFQKDQKKYNHVMYHSHKDGIYRITHEMYGSKNARGLGQPDSLGVLFSEAELKEMRHTKKEGETTIVEYYIEYETDVPHFQVFKYPISNNFEVRSPMGIALFANSISTLENIDEKYYSSRMDSINSRKRLFVDDEATKMVKSKDADGNLRMVKYFDQDETQFQPLKGMAGDGSRKAIETYAPVYDSAQHDTAIQAELNYLSSKCMLGTNYYDYQNGQVGYQNELNTIVSNSDTFRNRNKTLNRLRKVIIAQAKALLFLAKENNEYGGELDLKYEVQFDDDIMTDDQSMLEQYRTDAMDGLIPEYMYIMRAYKVDETKAKKILEEANENGQDFNDIVVEPIIDDEPPIEEPKEE